MASLSAVVCRNVFHTSRRAFSCSTALRAGGSYYPDMDSTKGKTASADVGVADDLGFAVSHERYELLARTKGFKDPFSQKSLMIDELSTRETPNEVPAMEPERIIACLCEADSFTYVWWTLKSGEPQRCRCGHWFKLIPFQSPDFPI